MATQLVRGVTFDGDLLPFLGVALMSRRGQRDDPAGRKTILTFPLAIIVTLGIFALVVNGLMLWLTFSKLSGALGLWGSTSTAFRCGVPGRPRSSAW